MNNEQFNYIITRYLQGKATTEEEKQLLTAIHASQERAEAFRAQTAAYRGKKPIANSIGNGTASPPSSVRPASPKKRARLLPFSPSFRAARGFPWRLPLSSYACRS